MKNLTTTYFLVKHPVPNQKPVEQVGTLPMKIRSLLSIEWVKEK